MLYCIGGEKGGTGKTAFSTNLAVCLATRGRDVLLVDADGQRSSAKWAMKRRALPNADRLVRVNWTEARDEIFELLVDMKSRYQDVIVDVGGTDQPELRYALAAADVLWSPMIPSECDLETAAELNDLVKLTQGMGNPGLRAYIALNLCPTHVHSEEAAEAREALAEFPFLSLAKTMISVRKPVRTAYKMRLGVIEMPLAAPDKKAREAARKAADEFWTLYEEVTGDVRDKLNVA